MEDKVTFTRTSSQETVKASKMKIKDHHRGHPEETGKDRRPENGVSGYK